MAAPRGEVRAAKAGLKTFASLSSRDFRFLWLSVVFMMASLQMQGVVRGYLTYDLTSSPLRLGLVNSGFALPMLTLALFGGVLADRLRKKRIIQFCQGLGFVTATFIGISIITETITWIHLLIASLVNGFIFAFMVPARNALITKLVPEYRVSNALALNAAAISSTTLVAPAIGGNLYSLIGPGGTYFLIAAFQLSALFCTGLIRKGNEMGGATDKGMLHRIKDGLSHIKRTPTVMALIVMGLSMALISFPLRSLLPVLVVDVFKRGPETLGLLLSILGGGAIVGSLTIASLGRKNRGLLLISAGILSGTAMLVAGLFPLYGVFISIMLVLGLSDSIRRSLTMALILESTPPEYQGRVSSVYTMNFGLMPLGTLPAAAIAERAGVPLVSLLLGIIMLVACAIIAIRSSSLRRLQ